MPLIGLLAVLFLVLLLVLFVLLFSLRTGVVPMPSSREERRLVLESLEREGGWKTVTELGAGWGGLSRSLARRFPDKFVRGIEASPICHFFSRIVTGLYPRGNLFFWKGDIYDTVLKSEEAYTAYLSGPAMRRLRESFERDRPTGGVLVSIAFAMPGWTPERVEYTETFFKTPVYLYRF